MVDPVVVDTDVVSYLFKNDTRAQIYRPLLSDKLLIVSFMTVAELKRWALRYHWGSARQLRLEAHLQPYIIYHSDEYLCRVWAEVMEEARQKGRTLAMADAWVAATALASGLPLVTHNRKDYQALGGLLLLP